MPFAAALPFLMPFSYALLVLQKKRRLSEPEDIHSRVKQTKINEVALSVLAKYKCYMGFQGDSKQKIWDDRPIPDPGIPPISLLYSGFGHFLDIMDGRVDVPGLEDIRKDVLEKAVDDFAKAMTGFFDLELDRMNEGLGHLQQIFIARRHLKIPLIEAANVGVGSAISDGHNIAENHATSIVVEFKNWHAGNDSLPQIEIVGYIGRLNTVLSGKSPDLFKRWNVPCLGLTIVGESDTLYVRA